MTVRAVLQTRGDPCQEHPYHYSFSTRGSYDQDMTITVAAYGPDGVDAADDFDYEIGTSGSGTLQFCGSEMPGRYRLTAKVEACNDDYDCTTFAIPSSSFQMRAPRTRTSIKAKPRHPHFDKAVTFVIRSRDERPRGYFATDGATVVLETRAHGRWVRVKQSKTYTSHGKAKLKYLWNVHRAVKVRARTLASDYSATAGSVSKPVTGKAMG